MKDFFVATNDNRKHEALGNCLFIHERYRPTKYVLVCRILELLQFVTVNMPLGSGHSNEDVAITEDPFNGKPVFLRTWLKKVHQMTPL